MCVCVCVCVFVFVFVFVCARECVQAVEFAVALGKEVLGLIDYIEEPLQDASLLPIFCELPPRTAPVAN